jgi:dipeptidyl aminopeptidase/acylaminoacyl peptidase
VFTTGASGLYEVPDRGGTARIVLEPGEGETDFHGVSALPDGRGILFVVHAGESVDTIDLWTGTERRRLFRLPGQVLSDASYAPTGHIVFSQPEAQTIWALPFSAERLEVTGEPLRVTTSGRLPHTGANGTLAYVPNSLVEVASRIVVVDRTGQVIRGVAEPRTGLSFPALSPDGRRLAVMVSSSSLASDLWVYEMDGGEATRLTFLETAFSGMPAWTPAGDELVQQWGNPPRLRAHRTNGSSPARDLGPGMSLPVIFPPDGKTLLYSHFTGQAIELWKREYPGETPGEVLLGGPGTMAYDLALSADGRFIAYPQEGKLLVRSYPEMVGPLEVASGGAGAPVWDPRGERLYYVLGRDVMEVSVTTRPTLRLGVPRRLFEFDFAPGAAHPRFAVTPDGESFVMLQAQEPVPAIVVVQNWLGLAE